MGRMHLYMCKHVSCDITMYSSDIGNLSACVYMCTMHVYGNALHIYTTCICIHIPLSQYLGILLHNNELSGKIRD